MTTREKGTISIGKKTIVSVLAVVLLAGGFLGWKFFGPEPSAKSLVYAHLKKKSGLSRWKVDASVRQANEPWLEFPKLLAAATDYKSMYRHIAAHVAYADELLANPDKGRKTVALRLMMEVVRSASNVAEDQRLAVRLCEAYFLPNLALCDSAVSPSPTAPQLIDMTINAIRGSEDDEGQFAIYRRLITREKKPHEADWARVQAANLLRRYRRHQEAQVLQNEINKPGMGKSSSIRRIKVLDQVILSRTTN